MKCIYGSVQADSHWVKGSTKTAPLNALFKKFKLYPCLLYIVNKPKNETFTIYTDSMLGIGDALVLWDTLEHIKK